MDGIVFEYCMSVIVPMYNSQEFLRRSVASLDAQTAGQQAFEVVLVDDGSTDGSLALARELAATRPNYVVLSQENGGVSAARNAGIRAARGRYLMFLDADDTLSAPSIESLVRAFDEFGDAVDLVTYPITFYDVSTGGTHSHLRFRWLKHTGVYDLQEFPFVAQTTINVCVRNDGSRTPTFIEGRRYCEDQAFNTPLLARKCALGFCAEANYGYYREPASATMNERLVEWGFDDLLSNLDEIVRLAEGDVRFCDYAYSLVLNNLGWRLAEHKLLPDFGDSATREANYERLGAVLRRVPAWAWEKNPYLTDVQRLWLMERFGVVGEVREVVCDGGGTRLSFADGGELSLGMPAMRLYWAVRRKGSLELRGCVYGPALDGVRSVTLFMRWKGGARSVCATYGGRAFEDKGVRVQAAWHFSVDLPGMERPYEVRVDGMADDVWIPGFQVRFDMCRSNGRYINVRTREFGDRRLVIVGEGRGAGAAGGSMGAGAAAGGRDRLKIGTVRDLPTWTMPVVRLLMERRERTRTGDFDLREVALLREKVPVALRALRGVRLWLYVGAREALARDERRFDGIVRLDLDELDGVVARVAAFLGAEKIVGGKLEFEDLLPCDRSTWERMADLSGMREQGFCYAGAAGEGEGAGLMGTCYDA
ncbi:MAG: glycosyltransferase family 2 protein [Atopobiaceae bacterium]|nr:glycosyltransferase family 2 protein [Atopobiaceae bacterium]